MRPRVFGLLISVTLGLAMTLAGADAPDDAETPYLVSPADCERLFGNASSSKHLDPEREAAARALASILTMDHPLVREIVARGSEEELYQLTLLTGGFVIPPATTGWSQMLSLPGIHRYFDAITAYSGRWAVSRRSLVRQAQRVTAYPSNDPRRRAWLARWITQAFGALERMLAVGPPKYVVARFRFSDAQHAQRIELHTRSWCSEEAGRRWRHALAGLRDAAVRDRLIVLVDAHLPQILADREKLYAMIAGVRSANMFRAAFDDFKVVRPNVWSRAVANSRDQASLFFATAEAPSSTPAPPETTPEARADEPAEFDAESVDAFVASHPLPRVTSLQNLPSLEIYRFLQEATVLVGDRLNDLHACSPRAPDVAAWRAAFDGTPGSARTLNVLLIRDSAPLLASEPRFAAGEAAFGRLLDWLGEIRALVARVGLDRARVEALPASDQAVLSSLLMRLRQTELLVESAVRSTRTRRRRILDGLDSISGLSLLAGAAIGEALAGDTASRDASATLQTLNEALDDVVAKRCE